MTSQNYFRRAIGQLVRTGVRTFLRKCFLPRPARFKWIKVVNQKGAEMIVKLGLPDLPPPVGRDADIAQIRVWGDWTKDDGSPGHAETTVATTHANPAVDVDLNVAKREVVFASQYIDDDGNPSPETVSPPFLVTDAIGPNAPAGFKSIAVVDDTPDPE